MSRVKIVKFDNLTAYYKPKQNVYRVYATEQKEAREICIFSLENSGHITFITHEPLTLGEILTITELFSKMRNL